MGNDRLTRQELSWLLAQEARGAAKALRQGVSALNQPLPPVAVTIRESGDNVESTLDALDDAISLLSDLQSTPSRRGRIDLAALLCEVAPQARISMSPGAGTEVFGDEAGLRRMLQVLVTQGQTAAAGGVPELSIRRLGSNIHIAVELGPDTPATGGTENRWLSRMAVRQGGRLELEGGTQSLVLPADASAEELVDLRKELEQAQQLGEAYARELAAVFAAGDLPASAHPHSVGGEQLGLLIALSTALVRPLRELFAGMREALPPTDPTGALARCVSAGYELTGELGRVAELKLDEAPSEIDLSALGEAEVQAAESRAARHGVQLSYTQAELGARGSVTAQRPALELLVRSLLEHAIAASPKGGQVRLGLKQAGAATQITVTDDGPSVPVSAREELIAGRIDPTSVGRPAGLWLLVASCIARELGTEVRIADVSGFEIQVDLPRA